MKIYTDGSCNAKNGLGGIGIYGQIFHDDGSIEEFRFHKGFYGTKTGRCELMAVIYALNLIEDVDACDKIDIISDSQYVINSITLGWASDWQRIGYMGKANGDLWNIFFESMLRFPSGMIRFLWVKGHNGNQGNESADEQARAGYKEACEDNGEVDEAGNVVVGFFNCRCLAKPEKIKIDVDKYLEENLTSSGCHKACGTKEWLVTNRFGTVLT